jgi:cell division protein FtsW (lipid II flippase)
LFIDLTSPTNRIERRLLFLASIFLGAYALALTFSDAARLRTWQVNYRWQHWLGLLVWLGVIWLAHRGLMRLLPDRDPFLFPIAALLSSWGLLTIWRLSTTLGLRQSAWLLLIGLVSLLLVRYKPSLAGGEILSYLRRFKYVWLTSGLLLTAATLVLGTNPMGAGPRLWLGWGGFYFQPSEPLKLLLIVYLSAYLADRQASYPPSSRLVPLLSPTLIMTGLALLLLVFQRDLGTAAIFLALYAVIVYAGTSDRRVLVFSALVLVLASLVGYAIFDVVSQRVDAWINPWLDPSGRSYQIVQSLIAIANGGVFGRGPGMGSPGLVPISQSDFIFSAISEEGGLLGILAMLSMLAIFVNRSSLIALRSDDPFRRLLATGLVAHLVGQSILIMAGNLRLLPLTGVTLPFVSYGGSSLVVSFFELLCLLVLSQQPEELPALPPEKLRDHLRTSHFFSAALLLGLAGAALASGWWAVVRGPDLLLRTDNPRRSIADRYVLRGSILDRHDLSLAESSGQPGVISRSYPYPALGPIVGYTHPVYGQAGLEASLDRTLRGLEGYPAMALWWEYLLYGNPPPGLDTRLSIDLQLQTVADQLFTDDPGALVLLNANTGEVLAIASSPTFDANALDTTWESLVDHPLSPLYDRAGMGLYPPGNALSVFLLAASQQQPSTLMGKADLADCAQAPAEPTLAGMVSGGCSAATRHLLTFFSQPDLLDLLSELGFFTAPAFPIETLASARPDNLPDVTGYMMGMPDGETGATLRVSPLQMALAAATLSNGGLLPAPRLVLAIEDEVLGWVTSPAEAQATEALAVQAAQSSANALASTDAPIWELVSAGVENTQVADGTGQGYAWYLGGTLAGWQGVPLAVAVVLEDADALRVQGIGRIMLHATMYP